MKRIFLRNFRKRAETKNTTEERKNNCFLKAKPAVVAIFCILLYPPTLKAFPSSIYIISYIIPAIYLFLNRKLLGKFSKEQIKAVFLLLCLVVFSALIPLIRETNDFSYITITTFFFRKALIFLSLLCLVIKKHGNNRSINYFLYYYVLTHVIYVIGTLVLVALPAIQDLWFSVFVKNTAERISSYGYTFRMGWQGYSGFRLTLRCSISTIFILHLKYGINPRQINLRQFFIAFVGCVIGNAFYGRSGLMVTGAISLIAILVWSRRHLKRVVLFTGLVASIIFAIYSLRNNPLFETWYKWMSTPVIDLITTRETDNASFSHLQEMGQTEIPPTTLIIGDGRHTEDGHYYMRTDIGYMRIIFFWGLIGAIPTYFLTFRYIYKTRRLSPIVFIQLLITFLIFEYKGDVYYEFLPLLFTIDQAYYLSTVEKRPQLERKYD